MIWEAITSIVAQHLLVELLPLLGSALGGIGAWWFQGRKWVFWALMIVVAGGVAVWLWNDRYNDGYAAGEAAKQAEIDAATLELNEALSALESERLAKEAWRKSFSEKSDELAEELARRRADTVDDSYWSLERVRRVNEAIGRSETD